MINRAATRSRWLDTAINPALAAAVLAPPSYVLSVLSTMRLATRSPSYGELQIAYRHRRRLPAVSAVAALLLVCRARNGRVSPTALNTTGGLLGAMALAWPFVYDPFLFSPRHGRLRVRPASDAEQVFAGEDTEVLGVRVAGEARAYPAWAIARPHAVTDSLADQRITVSYCGLTNSALAYRRDGGAGELPVVSAPNNNILYWDPANKALVQQLLPDPVRGDGLGRYPAAMPVTYTTWAAWRSLAPDTTIAEPTGMSLRDRLITRLMRATHMRTRLVPQPFFPVRGGADTALHPKARVFALRHAEVAHAYTRGFLADNAPVNDTTGAEPFTVIYDPGTDIAMAFSRWHNGQTLTFDPAGDNTVRDRETGTEWDVLGRATSGPLAGQQLDAIPFSLDKLFWFVWKHYHPDTALHHLPHERAQPETAYLGPSGIR